MRQRVFHRAGENVRMFAHRAVLGSSGSLFSRLHAAFALQRGSLDDFHTQRCAQLLHVDLVAVLAGHVDHVHRDDHRRAEFEQLRGQVKVAFDGGGVHDVQDGIRLVVHQVVAGDDFLQRVRRQGVNAGQVLNDHIVIALELAFLLFNRNTRPVADELTRTRQRVEHGRFAAVRVACERNRNRHFRRLLMRICLN